MKISQAIEVFKNNRRAVDLVILDMKIPYNGSSAFEKLKKIDADVKIIIASSYSVDQRIRKRLEQGCLGIQKPFTISSLSEKIINALNI